MFVFSADNGGPAYWSIDPSWNGGGGANNWPLKGSKGSNWEGGVRVVAFAAGGALPAARRGQKEEGNMHIADWYATFCELAGCDAADPSAETAGLPPVDSVSMWPLISGANSTSPRDELPLVIEHMGQASPGTPAPKHNASSSVLIQGDYKYVQGVQVLSYYQGPEFPNASDYGKIGPSTLQLCLPACLYNIREDPTEQNNIALKNLKVVKAMKARVTELAATKFTTDSDMTLLADCERAIIANNGTYGPWLDLEHLA